LYRCALGVVEKVQVSGLFKNAQVQGAQRTELRGVYRHTLSDAVCSAIPILSGQMRFVKAPGFYRQGILPFIIALPYRDAHPVNSSSVQRNCFYISGNLQVKNRQIGCLFDFNV
jgi:ABC-type antimicrobial peptide transport system ATPase subunit